jgi:glycine cleavage system H protein
MKRKPADIKYSANHSWARLEGETEAILGITDYLLKGWENINSIGLPKKGEKIKQDASFAEIDSEENFLSVISPLSGKIIEINKDIISNPKLLLEDPYDDGWLVRIKLSDHSEIDALTDRSEYEELLEEIEEEPSEEILEEPEDE